MAMNLRFKNRYGELALVLVSDIRHVNDIHGKDIDDQYKFGLKTAEKVALVTDNRGIQIGGAGAHDCYVVVHETPSTAAVARIETLLYVGGNPAQEIRDAARYNHHHF